MLNKTFQNLKQLLSPYKKEIICTLFASFVTSIIGVVDSLLLNYLIDNVVYSNAKSTLLTIALIMIFISILQISIKGLKTIWIQQLSYKIEINLMERFYEKILKIKYSFFENRKTGELISRLNDTRIVQMALSEGLTSIISNLIMFFVVAIALFCLLYFWYMLYA